MIQLVAVHIEEFRGIRELKLDLGRKSFAVLGPNGSGKSGVVDAIDFALTGNVARLSGAGTGGVSLIKHGPHVHQRDDPAAAKVSLTICLADSGQTAVLTRSSKRLVNMTWSRARLSWSRESSGRRSIPSSRCLDGRSSSTSTRSQARGPRRCRRC